jgi:outer membrane protein OmpA-like peptidoglycan-associated protein
MKQATRILILSIGAAAIAGCTNPDGSRNSTGTGGLIGAGVGALAGRAIDDGGTGGTFLGGVVGSFAGAAIGAALDRQQRELEQGLSGSGATVVNTGNQLVVTLPEAITFETASATVHPDYVDEIALVARSLRDNPDSTVQVIGHTDNVGSTEYNQGLSERRAATVAAILTSNGVAGWRVQTAGRGYHQPVASNDTPGGRAQNRRVEIVITPTGTPA